MIESVWMLNGNGVPAVVLPPVLDKPETVEFGDVPRLTLEDGTPLVLDMDDTARPVRDAAVAGGKLAVFEVDGEGRLRRSTSVRVRGDVR